MENEVSQKTSRHVAVATRHLIAQRDKAITIRDNAAKEVKEIDAALLALGWEGQKVSATR
jgi:hypothetical protein